MRWSVLLLCAALAACGRPEAQEVKHRLPTVVSLNPCSDAVLVEVADPAQILGLSHFSSDPASSSIGQETARRFSSVTGSAEELIALSPDFIVADQFVPVATRAALEQLGLPVVELPVVSNVEEGKRQVMELARLVGHLDRGKALVAKMDAALADAAPKDNEKIPAIVWQGGGIVPGGDTLVTDLMARTGFVNQSAERGMRQADYLPLEDMLTDPPHVLFVAGSAESGENRMLNHPALEHLDETYRVPFESSLLWCGGPTIARAVSKLAQVRNKVKEASLSHQGDRQ